ncbi:MAG: hypothetical protein ACQETH_14960 [Candidatus Rifleibacteriota bacterium]
MENQRKLRHFTAGMLRWLLNADPSQKIEDTIVSRCKSLVEESEKLDNLPSEAGRKKQAVLEVVPGAAMFWLGLYTGLFWLIPGAALGVAGSYLISDSINRIFSAGKEARFFRTLVYYLLRMENADGVISKAELANLRSVIEFIPVSSKEKAKWLKAIETPNGYLELVPEGDLTDEDKEKILSACWSLAICDGIDPTEEAMFNKFCEEFEVSEGELNLIKVNVEKAFARHSNDLWRTLLFARFLYPDIKSCSEEVYNILSLIALETISKEEFFKQLMDVPVKEENFKDDAEKNIALTIAATMLGLAAARLNNEKDSFNEIEEKLSNLAGAKFYQKIYADSLKALNNSIQIF